MIDENRLIEDIKDDAKRILAHVFGEVPSEFIDDYLKQMEWLINDQPKISEWIPCSERLPELDEGHECFKQSHCCLCAIKWWDGDITEEVGWYNQTGNWNLDSDNCKVIAWMPLPEEYKG